MSKSALLAELYRANAREALAKSEASPLGQVRSLHAEAAAAWLVLATRAEQPRVLRPR